MGSKTETLFFVQVSSTNAREAYSFHESVASKDSHIWPRTDQEIRRLSESGHLFGVRNVEGAFLAMCYVVLDDGQWELGGITVSPCLRNSGIGETLSRVALAHTIAFCDPWKEGQEIIAHVHESNDSPRRLLDKLQFQNVGKVEVSGDHAPASMKRNEAGNVVGDKFVFTNEGLQSLSRWFTQFTGVLRNGASAVVRLGPVTVEDLRRALREMASSNSGRKVSSGS